LSPQGNTPRESEAASPGARASNCAEAVPSRFLGRSVALVLYDGYIELSAGSPAEVPDGVHLGSTGINQQAGGARCRKTRKAGRFSPSAWERCSGRWLPPVSPTPSSES